MNYGYGKNVPILYTTDPYTSEDACVVAKSLMDEMQSIEINTVSIGINQNDFLLNLYGNKKRPIPKIGEDVTIIKNIEGSSYKPIPDLGQYAYGEVAVKRTLFGDQLLTDFKDESLEKPQDSDTHYYNSGKVIDITIYNNNPDLEDNSFNHQILKYLKSQTKFWQKVKNACEAIKKSGKKYTNKINYLLKRSRQFLNDEDKWKDDSVFGNISMDITLKSVVSLEVGQKITGRYGNKSVISVIRDDEDMPYYYDDLGNKIVIKLLFNILAIINRTTAYPLFEISINYICYKIRTRMQTLKTFEEKEKLLFDIIYDFNEVQYQKMKETYDGLSKKQKEDYINNAMYERIFINQKPMWETKPIFFRLLDIYEKYKFLTPYDCYIHKWGRDIKLLNKAYIGEMYILKLKQSSRKGFIVRSTGSINGKGLPERSYKNKNFTELHSSTPIRFGEYETLNFSIGMSPEDIELFHLLYRTSAKARRYLAKKMLSDDDDEFEIDDTFTSRVSEIFGVILKSLGLKIEFIDDDDIIQEYDDKSLQVFELDHKEYLCTEYDFMLIKRKKDIEKELLSIYKLIDINELDKLAIKELKNRNYLIGPDKDEVDTTYAYLFKDTVK